MACDSTTPTSRKRLVPEDESEHSSSPFPTKRLKRDNSTVASPSTPRALAAGASAVVGFRPGRAQNSKSPIPGAQTNGGETTSFPTAQRLTNHVTSLEQPPQRHGLTVELPGPRPAIKLAALVGTRWDTGELNIRRGKRRTAKVPQRAPKKSPATKVAVRKPNQRRDGQATTPTPKKASASKHKTPGSTGKNKSEVPSSTNGSATSPTPKSAREPTSPLRSRARSSTTKGILTPKGRKSFQKKNFGFDHQLNGEVFFKDLPKSPNGAGILANEGHKKAGLEDEEKDDEEIRCAICSQLDSEPPNEIVLCDVCDFAVHQKCYDLPEVPEGDWLCKSCAQTESVDTAKRSMNPSDTKAALQVEKVDVPNLDQHLRALQRVLLDRCSGRRRCRLQGQDDALEMVRQLVGQSVVAGESNSMLLLGPRGSGKTTMVETVLEDISREHRQLFHTVRLNGFIHTDGKLALREIWRQLGSEMEVEDDLVNRTNYADIMASLLALLSHPSEIMGTDEGLTSRSVVFVLDEFDLFATHPRQTLLYNLFDIAQSRKAPIAVLGCTTRLDVVEMLEKRVKSRFSHRYVYLSLPRILPAYWQICRQGLTVDEDDFGRERIEAGLEGWRDFHKFWTRKIEDLYGQDIFQALLGYHFHTSRSISSFMAAWILPLSAVSVDNLTLSCPEINQGARSLELPDSRLHLLSALSDLDLSLLIAAARLDVIAHTNVVNFAMAYDEYSAMMSKQRVQSLTSGILAVGGRARAWSRSVAAIAWERLISLGLLLPAGIGGARSLGQGGLDSKIWKVEVALEEIPAAVKLGSVLAKWCREI